MESAAESSTGALPPYAAVVLSGGTARRMGGADKASLVYAGRSLLVHALAAVAAAEPVVVVGPPPDIGPERDPDTGLDSGTGPGAGRKFLLTREEPAGGGPVAGLVAGLDALAPAAPTWVAVLAVDMPRVTADTLDRLRRAALGRDGAFLADADGRRQLAGVVSAAALDRVRPADPGGRPLHRLLGSLNLALVAAEGDEGRDVDTWADLD